ncbi:MAG: hypothetical protein R6V48_06290, partial [Fidelibacterota bacterium]
MTPQLKSNNETIYFRPESIHYLDLKGDKSDEDKYAMANFIMEHGPIIELLQWDTTSFKEVCDPYGGGGGHSVHLIGFDFRGGNDFF